MHSTLVERERIVQGLSCLGYTKKIRSRSLPSLILSLTRYGLVEVDLPHHPLLGGGLGLLNELQGKREQSELISSEPLERNSTRIPRLPHPPDRNYHCFPTRKFGNVA